MDKIRIRQALPEDISIIQEIAQQTWPSAFGYILTVKQIDYMLEKMYSLESLTAQIENQNHQFLLATYEGKDVAYASYEIHYQNNNWTKIHKLYALPVVQGKGIGRSLLDQIALISGKQNIATLVLNVNKYNAAIQFYEKYGFRIVEEEVIDIGNGFVMDDYIMRKVLVHHIIW